MSRSVDDLIAALHAFVPSGDPADDVHRLNELFDGFHVMADGAEAVPELLALFERAPQADFGTPGPLVRELERLPTWPRLLAASVERQPTETTVWMASRVLNSPLPREQRAAWLALMTRVASSPRTATPLRESVARVLDFQSSRSGRLGA